MPLVRDKVNHSLHRKVHTVNDHRDNLSLHLNKDTDHSTAVQCLLKCNNAFSKLRRWLLKDHLRVTHLECSDRGQLRLMQLKQVTRFTISQTCLIMLGQHMPHLETIQL